MRGFFQEFKKFAMRGNMLDMAVGIVIGAAFAALIKSFVDHLIMPPIGLLLGNTDFGNLYLILREGIAPGPYASLAAAHQAGATVLAYGAFFKLLIVAVALFLAIKAYNRLQKKAEEQPVVPPAPSEEAMLLSEIRDLLKAR